MKWLTKTSQENQLLQIAEICELSHINNEKRNEILSEVFSDNLDLYLEDGVLSEEEEENLNMFSSTYNIAQENLEKNQSLSRTVRAGIIRELLEGEEIQERITIAGVLPFKSLKSEKLIYVFQNVDLFEQKITVTYKGNTQGVSLKIAKGVYYRTGSFKGRPVHTMNTIPVAKGLLAFTDKHLYFSSSLKNFRINFDKIVTVEPYSDGVGIQKDGGSTKPLIFKNVDGWFCYNYIQNIN